MPGIQSMLERVAKDKGLNFEEFVEKLKHNNQWCGGAGGRGRGVGARNAVGLGVAVLLLCCCCAAAVL